MALLIGDNFNYQGKKPNFERDSFDTISAMKAYPETSIDEGHISYCKEDGKNYQYKSSNEIDATTGKWREFTVNPNNSDVYIVDYLSETEGTVTSEQYTELVDAVTNGKVITFPTILGTFLVINSLISVGDIELTADLGDGNLLYVEIHDDFTYISKNKNENLVPNGGTIGQVLTKTSDRYGWRDPQATFPEGGTEGQVLKKTADGVEWANDNDTTYQKVTEQSDGLMSKEDKTKLDNLTGAYVQILTQSEYNSLEEKDNQTVYFIKG